MPYRQDQIDILKCLYRQKYDTLFSLTSYKDGNNFIISWYRSARNRVAVMATDDSEFMAIRCFNELWRDERHSDKSTLEERKQKQFNSQKEVKARREAREWLEKSFGPIQDTHETDIKSRDESWESIIKTSCSNGNLITAKSFLEMMILYTEDLLLVEECKKLVNEAESSEGEKKK